MKTKFLYVSAILATAIGLGIFLGVAVLGQHKQEMTYTAFLQQVESGHVTTAVIVHRDVYGYDQGSATRYHTLISPGFSAALTGLLVKKGGRVTWKDTPSRNWLQVSLQASPFVLLALFWAAPAVAIYTVLVLYRRRHRSAQP
jgi:ATP-dependent Zn protease